MTVDKGIFHEGQRDTYDFHEGRATPWRSDEEIERYVPTHCCYCGVQCGMHLRVADGDRLAGRCEGGEVLDEDLYNLPRIQAGMRSAAVEALHLGTQEIRILHFHDTLMRYLEEPNRGRASE